MLGFAEYGDPKGKPFFYFHGWPGSHLSAQKYDELAKKLHIRVIAPDRPGYGLSDYQKGRTLLGWSNDVIALADYLKIKKFSVMGVSGGGPYAAVCAYKIPQRITKTGIIVGLSPIYSPEALDGMDWMAKIVWMNYGRCGLLRSISSGIHHLNSRWGPSWGLYRYLFGAKADRKIYMDPAVRLAAKKVFQEAFRQGYKGPDLDLKLYTTDWGFDVGDITSKIYLWYGRDDRNVTIHMARYYQSRIPRNELTVYPNEGHLISITHAEEIFKTLVA